MPQAKIWDNSDVLISDLKKAWPSIKAKINTPSKLDFRIHFGVGSNTFRAFHRELKPPSRVFRAWATEALFTRDMLGSLKAVKSQPAYNNWLNELVEDLQKYWRSEMKESMSFGPSYKLPNLMMKAACLELPPRHRDVVRGFLHVAWDSYTLRGLRNCVQLPNDGKIPTTATMGYVKTFECYDDLQKQIQEIAEEAGVPAIAYDYLAWDAGHGR